MKVTQHQKLLEAISEIKISRQFISALPSEVLKAIWEIALNIKEGNITCSSEQEAYFKKRKATIRKLSSKTTALKLKKQLLTPSLLQNLLTALNHWYGAKNES